MNNGELNSWFRKTLDYEGSDTEILEGTVGSFNVSIWSDPPANRFRIHAEICDADDLKHKEVLGANFHSTQDVRYAIHQGKIYAVFTHWLSELTEFELDRAFDQVLELAKNTLLGDYYSGDMVLADAYKETQNEKISEEKVRQCWDKCREEPDPNKKGGLFEAFIKDLLSLEPGFRKARPNFRTMNEEIDILIENKVNSSTWNRYGSPIIMVECKNTRDKTPAKDVRDFLGKIANHRNLCTRGFFFSVKGFEKGCGLELMRYSREEIKLGLVEGEDIAGFFKGDKYLKEFLEDSLINSMK